MWPGSENAFRQAAPVRASFHPVDAASQGPPKRALQMGDGGEQWSPDQGSPRGGDDGYCVVVSFDNISHHGLMNRVRRRIGDGKLNRLVVAFLKAGVMSEQQETARADKGRLQTTDLQSAAGKAAQRAQSNH